LYLKQERLGFPDSDWRHGKKGFNRPQKIVRIENVNALNIRDLEYKLDKFVDKNLAEKSGETYSIDLSKINIQKLIGRGDIRKKVNVSVDRASEKAIEKIEEAGGKVILLQQ
jgi:large subunit ribosomal protein L15